MGTFIVQIQVGNPQSQDFVADERVGEYEVRVCLDGMERTTAIAFGQCDINALLGATTLELFNLAVDPVRQRLVHVPGLMM